MVGFVDVGIEGLLRVVETERAEIVLRKQLDQVPEFNHEDLVHGGLEGAGSHIAVEVPKGGIGFLNNRNNFGNDSATVDIYCIVQSILRELVCNLSPRGYLIFHYLLQSIRPGSKYSMVKVASLEQR